MSLRTLAQADNRAILSDGAVGFGYDIVVTSPDGAVSNGLVGFSNDISSTIDPDTGLLIRGRLVSVMINHNELAAQGLALPENIASTKQKPWRVAFADINGNPHEFKVKDAMPDRSLGMVTCILEMFAP